jgi:hypothetical protein
MLEIYFQVTQHRERTFQTVVFDDLERSWTSIASSVEYLVSVRVSSEFRSIEVGHGEYGSEFVGN